MLRMPNCAARWGSASVLTLASLTLGSSWRAACWNCGAIILHGPHQGAQKSTNSGRSLRSTWRENVAVVNSMGSPVNKGCWQRPQLGCSDSFAVGTRLMDWQCGQTR